MHFSISLLLKIGLLWIQEFSAFSGFLLSFQAAFCWQCHSTLLQCYTPWISPVLSSEIQPSVFFTSAYAVLLIFIPFPQSASDLAPSFHTALYVICAYSQPGRNGSSYFQGFKWCDHNCTFGETLLVLYIKHLSFLLSEAGDPPRLPACCSFPTGKGNKRQENLKTHRKLLTETHCTIHSGTVNYEFFTWSAINKFSKEHKSLIFSQKCLHVLSEICILNLILQRRKNIPFGHMISYTVLQTLGYIFLYTIIDYCISVLNGSSVYAIFKPVS